MLTTRRGLSLIELMVGIVIGLFVLWGMTSVYINSVRGSRTTTAANQVNQDLRATLDIIANDVRRAGFFANASQATANPFADATTLPVISDSGRCLLYSYDSTFRGGTAGAVDAGTDFAGFRLGANGVLQALNSTTISSTGADCGTLGWENLTDERSIEITALTFDTVGSQCIAFLPANYVATDATTYTTWKTTTGTGVACSAASSGAPSPYPAATNTFVEVRQINIVLTGRSRTDPGMAAVTLRESVTVRNNRVLSP